MVAAWQTKQGKPVIGLSGTSVTLFYYPCGTEKCTEKPVVSKYFMFRGLCY